MADEALPDITEDTGAEIATTEGAAAGPQNFFQSIMADPQKRLYAIIGGAAIVIILGFAIFSGALGGNENRGKLVNLVQELDQSRAFEIVAKLKRVNIEGKVTPSERPGEYIVKVYENAVETAYLNLSRTNLLQDDGYGLFDQNDWAASDYDKRIKLTRAINGDLSRIVSRMEGLRSATVRVNIPEQQLFTEFQTPTTASVQVELENEGDELSKSQVKSIVNVLRGYVPNLEKDKVSIVDTQGNNYNLFRNEDESTTDDFIDEIEKINKTITRRIEKYLDTVVGNEKYNVSVSASISRERIQKQQTVYTEGAVGQRQVGDEVLQAGAPGNVAGPGRSGKNYKNTSSTETLYPSFEQQSVTYLPGRVTNVSVALAVDRSIPATLSLKQLQESVAAIVGPNTLPESVKITVLDLVGQSGDATPSLQSQTKKPGFFAAFFQSNNTNNIQTQQGGGNPIFKIFSIIGTIIGILLIGIVGLNFLSAAVNTQAKKTVDTSLGEDIEDISTADDNYGEQPRGDHQSQLMMQNEQALAQQEALLKEMMSDSAGATATATAPPAMAQATSVSSTQQAQSKSPKVEFENLLNNFQSAAQSKPDLLAKKIQVWLEEGNE